MAGGGTERVIEEPVGGFIESKAFRSSNEASGDKEMEQSGTIGSLGKSSDCLSGEEKPKDIDTGVDGNQQSRDGSQDFEVLEDLTKNLKIYGKENFRVILGSYLSPLQKEKTKLCQR
ncbi:hypothetical protein ElyMa_000357400 [Elysia marginata]|uniref:Uncharacterized protein n=1 Tax=Elysia marginata TaxID=1093978 RepID=A0AAV4FDY5_9GAST|nr:hypothetical protein ElyMa_000357400 [Elysia marginata]